MTGFLITAWGISMYFFGRASAERDLPFSIITGGTALVLSIVNATGGIN